MYLYTCVFSHIPFIFLCLAAIRNSQSSLLLETNQFLQYVKEKFSEVLLPVESITKQGLLGKGYRENVYDYNNINYLSGCYNCKKPLLESYYWIIFNILGAFGVVHKGEMIASDGTVRAVAIKTIKCKFLSNMLSKIMVDLL